MRARESERDSFASLTRRRSDVSLSSSQWSLFRQQSRISFVSISLSRSLCSQSLVSVEVSVKSSQPWIAYWIGRFGKKLQLQIATSRRQDLCQNRVPKAGGGSIMACCRISTETNTLEAVVDLQRGCGADAQSRLDCSHQHTSQQRRGLGRRVLSDGLVLLINSKNHICRRPVALWRSPPSSNVLLHSFIHSFIFIHNTKTA